MHRSLFAVTLAEMLAIGWLWRTQMALSDARALPLLKV
jgi:hypothetical protein